MKLRNKLIRAVNRHLRFTAQYYGKAGDKPNELRPSMNTVKQLNNKDLVGVEIGVAAGVNAKKIIEMLPIKKLYLVDPYLPYSETNDLKKLAALKKEGHERLSKYKNKEWIEKPSIGAVRDIEENLDFVYIDGSHDYENVMLDCILWYPKVKPGGIMGGHDFIGSHPELRRAVKDFCREKNVKLHIEPDDWWVIK
ncbi:MAG: class I SAM-dependent methyltransferase [Thermoplasmatales archaeon]|nr:class I SAM-dependent methyltransferase [Thermoplasmatales archaeon]